MTNHRSLSRRTAVARIGLGGIGATLAARGLTASAQQGTPAATPAGMQSALDTWVAGWEAGDPAQIASAYAEAAVVEIVPLQVVLSGRAAIEGYYTSYFAAFEIGSANVDTAFATDDNAAAEWTFFGEYTGELAPLPPGSGQLLTIRGANIMTLEDGQIVAERIYPDIAGALRQVEPMEVATPVE